MGLKVAIGGLYSCRWSIQDQMGQQRPHKEPIVFHRGLRLGPTESYGDEQSSFFSDILRNFILFLVTW